MQTLQMTSQWEDSYKTWQLIGLRLQPETSGIHGMSIVFPNQGISMAIKPWGETLRTNRCVWNGVLNVQTNQTIIMKIH